MREEKIYMLAVYPDEDGCYLAKFPDFPELAAEFGSSFDDCVENSSQFLNKVVADKVERGKPLPEPALAEDIWEKLDPSDGTPLCVVPVAVYLTGQI